MSLEDPTSSPDSDPDLSINERAILRKFLDTVNIDSDDSDDDLSSVHSVCSITVNVRLKKERNLNGVRAVTKSATAAFSARGKIGTFTDLHVPLWPRGRTMSKLKSCCCSDLYIFLILVLLFFMFVQTFNNILMLS